MEAKFCPYCHKRIGIPKGIDSGAIVSASPITITCGYCKKGKVKVQTKQPEVKDETQSSTSD